MIPQDLEFLAADHGFTRTVDGDSCSYLRAEVSISVSHNWRDGFETHLAYPQDEQSRIALGTLLAALDTPESGSPAVHASFLRANLNKLLNAPREIHNDLLALRFWHAPSWRLEWGRGIKMDSTSIQSETERLARLRNYFPEQR